MLLVLEIPGSRLAAVIASNRGRCCRAVVSIFSWGCVIVCGAGEEVLQGWVGFRALYHRMLGQGYATYVACFVRTTSG